MFLDTFSKVYEFLTKAGKAELASEMFTLQKEAFVLLEENRKLKEENAELKRIQEIESLMIRSDNTTFHPCFTLKNDPREIKYCTTCWGENKFCIQLGRNGCPVCRRKHAGALHGNN